ncbi:MAG TPA: hypothetical protein VGO58_03210 [Chitinophagaceae bacterium]|jgi:hypothetical protein|nr:hypothetical protein [Chitinophagaceae bacterium]
MEPQKNWDPGVKKFFVKILNSIAWGLLWMMASAAAGIYFELGYTNGKPLIYTILFYAGMIVTLFLLIRYLARIWKSND